MANHSACSRARPRGVPHQETFSRVFWRRSLLACLMLPVLGGVTPSAHAQQANPGFDPRQAEKRFEDKPSDQISGAQPRLPRAPFARPEGTADTKPLFVLRHVAIAGAVAIPHDRLVSAYQPYLGKTVSQADLANMASAVSDIYRDAGFHLSRAIVPVQDIQEGRLRLEVIEGSITEVAIKGDGADQFGIRPMLDARSSGNTLAVDDAGATVAPDQRPAGRSHSEHWAGGNRHCHAGVFG